jgi:hypothetical protein
MEWSVVNPHGMLLQLRFQGSIAQLQIYLWQHAPFGNMQCYLKPPVAFCGEIVVEVNALPKLSGNNSNRNDG